MQSTHWTAAVHSSHVSRAIHPRVLERRQCRLFAFCPSVRSRHPVWRASQRELGPHPRTSTDFSGKGRSEGCTQAHGRANEDKDGGQHIIAQEEKRRRAKRKKKRKERGKGETKKIPYRDMHASRRKTFYRWHQQRLGGDRVPCTNRGLYQTGRQYVESEAIIVRITKPPFFNTSTLRTSAGKEHLFAGKYLVTCSRK